MRSWFCDQRSFLDEKWKEVKFVAAAEKEQQLKRARFPHLPLSLPHSLTVFLSFSLSPHLSFSPSLLLSISALKRKTDTAFSKSLSFDFSNSFFAHSPTTSVLSPFSFHSLFHFLPFRFPLSPSPREKNRRSEFGERARLFSLNPSPVQQSSLFSWHAAWLKKNFDTKESSHRKIKNSSDKIARCWKEPRKDPRCSERRNGLLKQSRCYFCCRILFSRFVKKWFRLLPSFRRKFLSSFSDLKIRLCLKNNNNSKSSNLNRNSSNKKKNKSNSNIDCSLKNSYLCSM